MEIQKKKYISPSINAGYFRECIFGYLKEAHQIPQSEVSFWKFIDTVKFENGMISRECRLFRELKEFADKHPINKSSLLWQRYFENADADFIRDILLYLKEEKEKRKDRPVPQGGRDAVSVFGVPSFKPQGRCGGQTGPLFRAGTARMYVRGVLFDGQAVSGRFHCDGADDVSDRRGRHYP